MDPIIQSLVAGGAAGTCTDIFFFPIDTLKTRLQASGGFFANGGWAGVYRGLGSAVVASAPGASLFFICYDQGKRHLPGLGITDAMCHVISASAGEVAACSVRVPSEVVKQRVQAGQHSRSSHALKAILSNFSGEGSIRGLYRGYGTTLLREIPFTAIQFPLYEKLKVKWAQKVAVENLGLAEGAICGSIAGGIAAAATTPLDVLKTRIMLNSQRVSVFTAAREIFKEGPSAFFRGIVPRTLWISAGGAVFLGIYEVTAHLVKRG